MNTTVWMAVAAIGAAVWLWLPPDVTARVNPSAGVKWPAWAKPVPGAMPSSRRWLIASGLTAAIVVYAWGLSWLVVLAAPFVVVGLWLGLGRLEPRRIQEERQAALHDLPNALDCVQACVRAGQPLRNAIEIVRDTVHSAVSSRLATVINAVSVGMSDAEAWGTLKDDPVMGAVARDLARSAEWGTAVTEVLAGHSVELRRRGRSVRLTKARSVGVQTVLPLGLCYLPAFILLGVVPVLVGGVATLL
ncbi:MAG: type II secretion system F family protein [Propionibacteriaceae bacterium]|jgi:pilus assembly protein TadC|nr:type II secretion system F family protein [Propionibacteriaceae bacterium]